MSDDLKTKTTEENLEQVQKEKIAAEAIKTDAELNAEKDRKDREAAIVMRDEKKEELMKPVSQWLIATWWTDFLTKEWVTAHMNIRMSQYLKRMAKICIENPILIKLNQDTALEIEKAIEDAVTEHEQFESKKSLAATLHHIQKLKDEIDPENVWTVLEQEREIIRQLKNIINTL